MVTRAVHLPSETFGVSVMEAYVVVDSLVLLVCVLSRTGRKGAGNMCRFLGDYRSCGLQIGALDRAKRLRTRASALHDHRYIDGGFRLLPGRGRAI